MISFEKRKSSAMYWTAAVIFACCFAQTAHCLWLRKTERREGRREAAKTTTGVREGTIVFGRDFEKGAGVTSQVFGGTKTPNASVGDYVIYQADQPGWSRGQAQDARLTSAWQRMTPTLQCGRDQLRFRAVGSGASNFVIQSGNGPLLPLSQVPSTCGYNMQRNSFALLMVVPYNGCNVVQEGGSYVLPMRWHGVPVTLWCPKPPLPSPPPPPPPPQDPPTAGPPTTARPTTAKSSAPSSAPVITPKTPQHPMLSPPQPATTAAPPMPPHMAPPMPPHMPPFPYVYPEYFPPPGFAERPELFTFPYFLPVYPNYPEHTPAANLTKPPPADPHVPMYPFPPYVHPFPWQLPLPVPQNPQPTTAGPTAAQTTAAKPGDKPQVPQNFPPPAQIPFFPPYPPPYLSYPPYPHNPTADPEIPTQMPPAPHLIPGFNYLPFYGQFPAQFMQYRPFVPFP